MHRLIGPGKLFHNVLSRLTLLRTVAGGVASSVHGSKLLELLGIRLDPG